MRKEWTLFITFLKIGAFTFGGGYAMIALLENEFVERKKWIKKDDFLNMVAIAESTPGPVAINSHIHRLQNCRLVRCCGGYRGGLYSFVYRNFLHLTVF